MKTFEEIETIEEFEEIETIEETEKYIPDNELFSSPFIEERLYFVIENKIHDIEENVLVPFYRGAVVFREL